MAERIEITERWWSPSEIADALNLTPQTVSGFIRRGMLTGYRMGKLWRVADGDLQTFLRRVRNEADCVRRGEQPSRFADTLREASEETQPEIDWSGLEAELQK